MKVIISFFILNIVRYYRPGSLAAKILILKLDISTYYSHTVSFINFNFENFVTVASSIAFKVAFLTLHALQRRKEKNDLFRMVPQTRKPYNGFSYLSFETR